MGKKTRRRNKLNSMSKWKTDCMEWNTGTHIVREREGKLVLKVPPENFPAAIIEIVNCSNLGLSYS